MQEISFSIPLSGVIRIDEDSITVTVNRAETIIHLEPKPKKEGRISLERGQTMFDLVLDAARNVIREKDVNQFSAAELYHEVLRQHPGVKRNSWTSHVIACAPNHPSFRHYTSKRDYFSYIGPGLYRLNDRYMVEKTSDGERTLFNH